MDSGDPKAWAVLQGLPPGDGVRVTIRTTVAEVLACFDSEFREMAAGFARGEYLLWLGSGISRDVVPSVPDLLKRLLAFLQANVDDTARSCPYRKALEEMLDLAGPRFRSSVDLSVPIAAWPGLEDIVERLTDKYSDALDIQVRGRPGDYLVWSGLDVPATYGSHGLEPDVEHLCIAILMLEGVVKSAPTTNWDGLVEAAMERLAGGAQQVLRVVVRPDDLAEAERRADLVKFHGCAVRAAADEATYRGLLIARKSQISGWTTRTENRAIKQHLEGLYTAKKALVVGLSAQDPDIHTVLHQAIRNLRKHWPSSPPAVVFAEQGLHHHHKHVMRVTYGDDCYANADAIEQSALLGAYAKPTLLGLVLFTLADKLCQLLTTVPELAIPGADLERLRTDIRNLRDQVGLLADPDPRLVLDALVAEAALTLSVFRTGRVTDPRGLLYQPLTVEPIGAALHNPDFPAASLGRLAVALAILGRGSAENVWVLTAGSSSLPDEGVLRVETPLSDCKVFLVRDSRALAQLELDGLVDLDDARALVVQAEAARPSTTRSPASHFGRTGRSAARHIDMEALCATIDTADELFEAFRLEAGL